MPAKMSAEREAAEIKALQLKAFKLVPRLGPAESSILATLACRSLGKAIASEFTSSNRRVRMARFDPCWGSREAFEGCRLCTETELKDFWGMWTELASPEACLCPDQGFVERTATGCGHGNSKEASLRLPRPSPAVETWHHGTKRSPTCHLGT